MIPSERISHSIDSVPHTDFLLVGCDERFFLMHFPAFFMSAARWGFAVHLHIVNPSPQIRDLARRFGTDTGADFGYSEEITDLQGIQPRSYYAVSRLLVAPKLFERGASRMFILDVDSLVRRRFAFPDADYGLFLRPGLSPAMIVLAAGIFYARSGLPFVQATVEAVHQESDAWLADQRALWKVHQEFERRGGLRFARLTNRLIDWEFQDGTAVWSGKGARKLHAPEFLAYRDECVTQLKTAWPVLHADLAALADSIDLSEEEKLYRPLTLP